MNDIYESYSIDTEIIDEMEPYELENLMTELTYLNKQIQNRRKVVIDSGGKFRQIYNILTGKRSRLQNKIELDVTETIEIVSSILPILSKDIHLIKTNQAEIEKKLLDLTSITVLFLEYADQNLIQLSPEIKNELLLLIDSSVDLSSNKKTLPSKRKTSSKYMLEPKEYIDSSNKQCEESVDSLEDPKLKKEIEALKKDGHSDKYIEYLYGKLYIGLRTTDSNTTRRLKFKPPIQPLYNGGFIKNWIKKSDYEGKLRLFEERKAKIEDILSYEDGYIIDKEWIYFIDKFTRREKLENYSPFSFNYGEYTIKAEKSISIFNDCDETVYYKEEIYYCLCRIRIDASEPEETVFEDVNKRSFININDGMIYFLDSKYNQKNILLPR